MLLRSTRDPLRPLRMRPFHRLRRTGQPHVVRSTLLSVLIVLVLGITAGSAVGFVAVKVFDLVPLSAFSQPPGGQHPSGR